MSCVNRKGTRSHRFVRAASIANKANKHKQSQMRETIIIDGRERIFFCAFRSYQRSTVARSIQFYVFCNCSYDTAHWSPWPSFFHLTELNMNFPLYWRLCLPAKIHIFLLIFISISISYLLLLLIVIIFISVEPNMNTKTKNSSDKVTIFPVVVVNLWLGIHRKLNEFMNSYLANWLTFWISVSRSKFIFEFILTKTALIHYVISFVLRNFCSFYRWFITFEFMRNGGECEISLKWNFIDFKS